VGVKVVLASDVTVAETWRQKSDTMAGEERW